MSFTAAPVGAGYPVEPVTDPYHVEFAFTDDGSGGSVFVNGQGYTGANLLDLKTFFGVNFRSIPLLTKFLGTAATTAALVTGAFFKNIDVTMYQISNGQPSRVLPVIVPLQSGPVPNGVPGFNITGPSVAGIFRVSLRLRHTIGR